MPAKKKTTPPKLDGVEKVIAFLTRNKANIRGLVLSVGAKPGKKVSGEAGSGDGCVFCVDLDSDRYSDSTRSILTQGLANQTAQHVLPEPRHALFG